MDSTAALCNGVDTQLHNLATKCVLDDFTGSLIGPVVAELGHNDAAVGNIEVDVGGTKVLGGPPHSWSGQRQDFEFPSLSISLAFQRLATLFQRFIFEV